MKFRDLLFINKSRKAEQKRKQLNIKPVVKAFSNHCKDRFPNMTVQELNNKRVDKVLDNAVDQKKAGNENTNSMLVVYDDNTHIILNSKGCVVTIVTPSELVKPFLGCTCDYCKWLRRSL